MFVVSLNCLKLRYQKEELLAFLEWLFLIFFIEQFADNPSAQRGSDITCILRRWQIPSDIWSGRGKTLFLANVTNVPRKLQVCSCVNFFEKKKVIYSVPMILVLVESRLKQLKCFC